MARPSELDTADNYEDFVSMKTLSGASLCVPENHYHGIWTDGDSMKCLVCGVRVLDAGVHKQEQHHKLMVAAAVEDKHGIRPLSETLNHCLLCNEIVGQHTKKDHKGSVDHCFKMCASRTNLNKYDSRNISFEDNVTSHKDETLMDNLTKTFEEISLCQPVTFIEKPKETHYLTEARDKYEFCVICKVNVPSNIRCIQEHIDGTNHCKMYNFLLNSNKVERIPSGGFYCKICKVTVGKTLEIDHIDSSSHTKKRCTYDEVINKKAPPMVERADEAKWTHYLMEVRDQTEFCKVCNVEVSRNVRNIQEHIDGSKHNELYMFLLNLNKVIRIPKGGFYCKICEVTVGKTSEIDHIDSSTHIKKRCTHNEIINKKARPYMVEIVDKPKKTHHFIKLRNRPEFCKVCKVKVTGNIREHINGSKHNEIYNFLLKSNKLERISSGSLYCKICKVIVKETLEIDHINSNHHTKKICKHDESVLNKTDTMMGDYCDTCRVYVPNGTKRRIKLNVDKELLDTNTRSSKNKSYHCYYGTHILRRDLW